MRKRFDVAYTEAALVWKVLVKTENFDANRKIVTIY